MFTDDYFLRYRSEEIAWHTAWLANVDTESKVGHVAVRLQQDGDGVEAVLYTPRARRTFAHATSVIDELGMTIVDARIVPIANGYSIDTYIVMELDRRMEIDESRLNQMRRSLTRVLATGDDNVVRVTRAAPRQVRMFTTKTSVQFGENTPDGRTVLDLITADRPGLLSEVGQAFIEQGIDIEAAKIMTIGERAEDVFYISDEAGAPLTEAAREQLCDKLVARLDDECKT